MEQQLIEIREQQKKSWNTFSPGWKKWDEMFMEHLLPMGNEIVKQLDLKPADIVLDIAAGTGEPGLTIATRVTNGKVVITDLAEKMLTIASENAERKGIKNVEFNACDVTELPYDDNSFDAISCRLGFMFFPDVKLAIKEMKRVLKPGGKISASVWLGPENNFWITAIMGTIGRLMQLPATPAGAPGMFRCAAEGFMKNLFEEAGLKNIQQTEVTGKLDCGDAETYWVMMNELAAPVVAALSNADEAMKQKIYTEVIDTVNKKFADKEVVIDSSSLVICGEK
jgi:ubiquinone/menaquinone biosynthesis C-methylase UbiE